MAAVNGRELLIERGEGVYVWDATGKRYLDGAASLWYCNVGHGRREIAGAIAAQLDRLASYHVFGDVANGPALELAERLSALAPTHGSKLFLTSGGADSIDTAGKLARLWHATGGEPSRTFLIGREHAYHGTHGLATSILGMPYREGFGTLVAETAQVAWDDASALEAEILRLGPERVAAFVYEPVIGAGGVMIAPDGYLDAVTEICRRHGVLTIADAVIGGFGRIGEWFAVERFGLEPDLIVFAKGVTSGYLPLGGVVASARVAEPFWEAPGRTFAHGATYSGHPTCCAAALANIQLLERDGLVHRARSLEGPFHAALRSLESHALVGEVRGGVGLMAAVGLEPDLVARDPDVATRLWRGAREAGLLTRWIRDGVAVAPPLIVEDEHIAEMVDALEIALDGAV